MKTSTYTNLKSCIFILLFVSICIQKGLTQEFEWKLNPKVLTDTMDVHIYPQDPNIFIEGSYDIRPDNEGYIWVSTKNFGLLRLDINNPLSFKQNKPEGYCFDKLNIHKMYEFGDSLYFTSERGFLTYDPGKEIFIEHGQNDLSNLSPYKAFVNCMAYISEDSIVTGGKYGLTLFNKKENKITKHLWKVDSPKDGHSTHNLVRQLQVDPYDPLYIWGVGRKGLFRMDKRTWEREYFPYFDDIKNDLAINYMNNFIITDENIFIIYCGEQRNWGLGGNQILKFNKKSKEWKLVASQEMFDKFGNHFIVEIGTIQKYGKYALITSRAYGVQLIDTETDSVIQTYFKHPKFNVIDEWKNPNRLLDYYLTNVYTATIDKNGYLWGSYLREFIVRSKQPVFIKNTEEYQPKIKLNTLYVNSIKHKKQNFVDPNQKNRYLLNERERDVAFDFGIVNPIYDSLNYEYKYNSQIWKPAFRNRTIQINKLDAGENTVQVRALANNKTVVENEFYFYSTPRFHENWWFILGLGSLIGLIMYSFYKLKIQKIKDEEVIKTSFNKKIAEMEMEVLKAQMNPHFLFNSLNSIKHYSINKDKRETSQYITIFSHLLRQILQNSNSKTVSLAQELKAIELYVEVEKKRFENKFDFALNLEDSINEDTVFIPPMILQPFVENAIWHGLLSKNQKGTLAINISIKEDQVICEIIDDGIGRDAANQITKLKSEYKKESLGTKITSNRLKLAEEIYGAKTQLEIIDLFDKNGNASGTKVIVHLPRIYKNSFNPK